MNPSDLLGPANPLGYPAPFWFIVLFKVLGFVLHIVPMSLWYAGIIIAMLMYMRGSEHGRTFSRRLMKQMPIIVAFGINLGIVPLLFIQVAYYRVFYPATILMAWPWFSIFGMLIIAYYGVYIYASGLRKNSSTITRLQKTAGWISSIIFIVIGFLFANAFSLMVNLEAWHSLWSKTQIAGAPLGLALNTADATLIPRWLMMFGLAIMTTAAYVIIDAYYFARKESDAYKAWAQKFALKLYLLGILWFAAMGSWYVFGTWSADARFEMMSGSLLLLTVLTAISPGLPFLLIAAQYKKITGTFAFMTGLAQFLVLALNGMSRHALQHVELRKFVNLSAGTVNVQWSPLILFLLLFVFGLGVIIWMLRKVAASRSDVS